MKIFVRDKFSEKTIKKRLKNRRKKNINFCHCRNINYPFFKYMPYTILLYTMQYLYYIFVLFIDKTHQSKNNNLNIYIDRSIQLVKVHAWISNLAVLLLA
jgi:hypothetical protein